MKILILANYDLGLYKFRRELLEELVGAGHEVICCLPDGSLVPAIEALGCRFIPCPWLSRHGMNPAAELRLLRFYKRLRKAQKVFFQNAANRDFMLARHMVREGQYDLLPGSGVNLEAYPPVPYPGGETVDFVFVSRIMREKGIDQVMRSCLFLQHCRDDAATLSEHDWYAMITNLAPFEGGTKMIHDLIGLDWGKNLFSFAIPGMDGDGFNMCHKVGAGHTPVTMELMYQLPDNMNHFYVEGAFRQPCYWCNKLGERFIPEDEVFNTTFVGNAINHLPGKVGFAIFDANMLKRWKKNGPDILSHVHPHDLYEGFEAQWNADLDTYKDDEGNPYIAQADTLEELAEQLGINVDGFLAAVEEYNQMCYNGWDDLFEKDRKYMVPLEEGPFYGCKQYMGAYGTLGGVLVNHKLEVMTDDYETIPGLYCVGTDACTIYGDSYNFCISGNTMGFCLNSGRIAGENAAALAFGGDGADEWDDDGEWEDDGEWD